MKNRSTLEICAPLVIFLAAAALCMPTRIIAIAWMTIGVFTLGYRCLEDFPADRIPYRWLRGRRRAVVLFYHLAWWPWYVRAELRDFARRVRSHLGPAHRSSRSGPVSPDPRAEDNQKD